MKLDRNIFERAYIQAQIDCYKSQSGWGVALFLEEDQSITLSRLISQNTYQIGAFEIYRVKAYQQDDLLCQSWYTWKNYDTDEFDKIMNENCVSNVEDLFLNYFADQINVAYNWVLRSLNEAA